MALECSADGATYPTLYYDNVNVPALSYCMRIPAKEAEQYAPFGCGEMNIVGKTVSPPNTILNLTKFVNIILNEGIDPFDGVRRNGPVPMKRLEDIQTFEEFYDIYQQLNDYYAQMCVDAQIQSYDLMNSQVSFLYNSILMDGCIEKGKALLDGGAQYMGGSCETFGNVNASDALTAIKKLVFDEKKYTLRQINDALLADFEGYEKLRQDLWKAPKYGNDNEEADAMSQRVYESIAKPIRDFGIASGLQYYGIVIINNNTNTFWGNKTSASADGRHSGVYLNPSNNPQGGADVSGPTSMLNSLLSIDPKYHVGSVQNIKFQKNFFKENLDKISMLFDAYFKKGGCQLMVTVVDSGALEDAMIHPEDHKDLIVRVSGFSAVFVELDREVQTELLSRTLYEGA
jgi:pyruvate-formate lyase